MYDAGPDIGLAITDMRLEGSGADAKVLLYLDTLDRTLAIRPIATPRPGYGYPAKDGGTLSFAVTRRGFNGPRATFELSGEGVALTETTADITRGITTITVPVRAAAGRKGTGTVRIRAIAGGVTIGMMSFPATVDEADGTMQFGRWQAPSTTQPSVDQTTTEWTATTPRMVLANDSDTDKAELRPEAPPAASNPECSATTSSRTPFGQEITTTESGLLVEVIGEGARQGTRIRVIVGDDVFYNDDGDLKVHVPCPRRPDADGVLVEVSRNGQQLQPVGGYRSFAYNIRVAYRRAVTVQLKSLDRAVNDVWADINDLGNQACFLLGCENPLPPQLSLCPPLCLDQLLFPIINPIVELVFPGGAGLPVPVELPAIKIPALKLPRLPFGGPSTGIGGSFRQA